MLFFEDSRDSIWVKTIGRTLDGLWTPLLKPVDWVLDIDNWDLDLRFTQADIDKELFSGRD